MKLTNSQKNELQNLKYNLEMGKYESIHYLERQMLKPHYGIARRRARDQGLPAPKRSECRQHKLEHYKGIIDYLLSS